MPTYNIGSTQIEYTLDRKSDIERRYIEITPSRVLVTVCNQDNDDDIRAFLNRKERWLFDNTQKINDLAAKGHRIHRFITGVKIPYRGRRMKLTVTRKTTPNVEVTFRNGFTVSLPDYATDEAQDDIVEDALRFWMKRRIKKDAHEIVGRFVRKYGFNPKAIRIKDQKHLWGSCSTDGTINLNWHLIYAPKPVLEYAILHELCHLKHRTHCAEFWALVGKLMPDYEAHKAWLNKNENIASFTVADDLTFKMS
ncbi:MAG: M48 family metallopeptidase [Alphaproteobacteria bacterium]